MAPQAIERRVDNLEKRVTILEQLPSRVDALSVQISQLRDEMQDGFSAMRARIEAVDERLSTQMRVLHEDVIARLVLIQEGRPRRRKR